MLDLAWGAHGASCTTGIAQRLLNAALGSFELLQTVSCFASSGGLPPARAHSQKAPSAPCAGLFGESRGSVEPPGRQSRK
eukprot:3409454-Alexandrium_andersonii.AAC.1